jgi:hypothetical protein
MKCGHVASQVFLAVLFGVYLAFFNRGALDTHTHALAEVCVSRV